MSLILDALKRAERERQGDAIPGPGEVPVIVARPAPPRGRGIAGAAVIIVGLAVAAALLWDAFRGKPAPKTVPPQVSESQAPPPVIIARPAPPEPAPAVVPGTETVASLDDLTDELDAAPAPAPAKAAPLPAPIPKPKDPGTAPIATSPAPRPRVAQPTEIPQAQSPPAQSPPVQSPPAKSPPAQSPPAEKPRTEAAPAEIPPALTQPAPLRKFREMRPDYRADFPALKIEIHVYEKAPQRRFVMVNGRKYREGERLSEGPTLIEIVPEGVVLEYRGEKVLYTLGR